MYKLSISTFALLLFFTCTNAQELQLMPQKETTTELSTEKLKAFVTAISEIMPIQQQAQQEMIGKISEKGLTVESYNTIATQVQNTGSMDGIDEQQIIAFQEVNTDLEKIQNSINEKIIAVIDKNGLDVNEYQELVTAYNTNPAVKEQIDNLLREAND
ncbi:MAG: DUF4168 domain-containing protein [Luteibaculaceae bacterium]